MPGGHSGHSSATARITEWQQRPFAACYPVVFLDAIHYKVLEDGRVVNQAACMVVGIDLEGYQDVLVVAADHPTGFSEAIATVFPRADV